MSISGENQETVDLKQLIRQRGGFKARITFFKNLYDEDKIKNIGELKSTLSRLSDLYKKFDAVQSQIEDNNEDDDDYTERFQFERVFGELEAAILTDINKLEVQTDVEFKAQSQEIPNNKRDKSRTYGLSIKLPDIKLPTFNGDITEWLNFRNLFQEFIHHKPIDEITKFYYLLGAVRDGKAYRLIESIPVSSENYNNAWKSLVEYYDNNVEIQKNHMKLIYNISSPVPNSSESLQKFIDELIRHRTALHLLKIDVDSWDLFFYHHICEKLDSDSKIYVIENTTSRIIPSFADLINIIKDRLRILESVKNSKISSSPSKIEKINKFNPSSSSRPFRSTYVGQSNNSKLIECYYCKQNHLLHNCPKFADAKFTPSNRLEFTRSNRLCTNCLSARHKVFECRSKPCALCSLKHHILLHWHRNQNNESSGESSKKILVDDKFKNIVGMSSNGELPETIKDSKSSTMHVSLNDECPGNVHSTSCSLNQISKREHVLLATAVILVKSSDGRSVPCRVLLDSGSDANFITKNLYNLLKIKSRAINVSINGIGGKPQVVKLQTNVEIKSRSTDYSNKIGCFVISKITENLPSTRLNIPSLNEYSKYNLADPAFNLPNKIEMLIGAEIFFEILTNEKVIVNNALPPLQSTVFGYIISGKIDQNLNHHNGNSFTVMNSENIDNEIITKQLQKFWDLEEICVKNNYSKEELAVEEHYVKHTSRNNMGRYSVKMPLNNKIFELGDSYKSTLKRYLWLEAKLDKNPEVKTQYMEFINEYKNLGHMELVPNKSLIESSVRKAYYLPQQYVIREKSSTTRLRVVFNASSKTDAAISLNDAMFAGPTVQQELIEILLRFRKHTVALTADITKMYRQIEIDNDQRDLLRILWRDSKEREIECYRLKTVSYGTTSAPYLATRTLLQLAYDEEDQFPIESQILKDDFYVDDLLTGSSSIKEANKIKIGITTLLKKGGFELQKWASNEKDVVPVIKDQQKSETISILGTKWNTNFDTFNFDFNYMKFQENLTKRSVLSEIAQLYDPMGICAPVIFLAKRLMQKLWTFKQLSWDDELPPDTANEWSQFREQIMKLKVTIPRCVVLNESVCIEVHGFGDASDPGYGAVIYIKSKDRYNNTSVNLLCAKSKVAPLKKQTTPRLELCAALLLSSLVNKVSKAMDLCVNRIVLWSDSQITLNRINAGPSKYKQFVANRINQILEMTNPEQWWYVQSTENPADVVSRGIKPGDFNSSSIWWHGPKYLMKDIEDWPIQNWKKQNVEDAEFKKDMMNVYVTAVQEDWSVFTRFSSYNHLVAGVAICLRLFTWFKSNSKDRTYGRATPCEIEESEMCIIRSCQSNIFYNELRCLKSNQPISNSSKLRSLNIFLDKNDLIRLGGRLKNANLPFDIKHPVVLSKSHELAKLIVRSEHIRLLHAGAQTLIFSIRQKFWIIGCRSLCKQVVRQCVTCFKTKPELTTQLMGNLPSLRVNKPSKIFYATGVDFAGPFLMRSKLRKQPPTKFYISIFICFTTRAIHIEIVEDLTTQSFIAALIRFVSRRGFCTHIYSDNATNFVGAKWELKELERIFFNDESKAQIVDYCANHKIQWHNIPPRSPHFGGLWEASVKSAKHHMRRVVGKAILTHDEYQTLFCQIEAILNSRPLMPLSDDANDLNYLSPGHFIVGDVLTALPNPSLDHLNYNKLGRFQRVQYLQQQFWKHWSTEYLATLQKRYKWNKMSNDVKIGQIVLLREENIPPQMWILGRITQVFHGTDGLVRVVRLKTKDSELTRAVQKISILPLEDEKTTTIKM